VYGRRSVDTLPGVDVVRSLRWPYLVSSCAGLCLVRDWPPAHLV